MFGKVKKLEACCSELESKLKETQLALDTAVHSLELNNKKYNEAMHNIHVITSDLRDDYEELKEAHKKPTEFMKGIKYAQEKLGAYFPEVDNA